MSKRVLSSTISRRGLLKGIGVGALAATVPAFAYRATPQERSERALPSAFKRFMVGDFELTVIQDRVVEFTPEMFESGAPEGGVELAELLDAPLATLDTRLGCAPGPRCPFELPPAP